MYEVLCLDYPVRPFDCPVGRTLLAILFERSLVDRLAVLVWISLYLEWYIMMALSTSTLLILRNRSMSKIGQGRPEGDVRDPQLSSCIKDGRAKEVINPESIIWRLGIQDIQL
ncbi:unnamed protein product [Gordionus sp. m RMFG-2023]